MKKLVYILGMLFIYATITYGQGITMTIGSRTASVGDTVTIPISVTNFNNIGAVSLKIQFNSTSLSYIGVTNQPTSGTTLASSSGNVITIAWYSTIGLNIATGKFLDIKFVYKGGSSNLDFITSQCEVSDILGNLLVVDFINGNISPSAVTKLTLPQIMAVAGNNISIPLTIENYEDVGAISLKITYDPSVLNFIDVSDLPLVGTSNYGASSGVLTIGWFDTNPLSVTDGLLAKLNFKYIGNSSNLNFNTAECEISNLHGNLVEAEYVNGSVTFDISNIPNFILGEYTPIPGSDITIPLDVQKLNGVGAISLKINYNNSVLTFTGFENQPASGTFTANAAGGVLSIGWFNTSPLNIDSGKFVDLKFNYIGGNSELSFISAQCEIADSLGALLNAAYIDGNISPDPNSVPLASIPSVSAIAGDDIVIPISVDNFQNVGAVSLKINYNPSVLVFLGVENQPTSGTFQTNALGNVLSIGWFSTLAYGIDSTKFVDLKFHYIGGSSPLGFNISDCEISNTLGVPLFAAYQSGNVAPVPGTIPAVILKSVKSAPGSSVTIPVIVNNFQNVGAISLKIQYDPTVLSFIDATNQPSIGTFNVNAVGGVLSVGWFNTSPFNQDSVKLVDLNFNFIGGTSDLKFIVAECEISDTLGNPLFTEYIDGNVTLEEGTFPVVQIPNAVARAGDVIAIPINVQKLIDVGAVSLKIQYNPAVLTFLGTANEPSTGTFNKSASGGVISIGWFNTDSLGIDLGIFVNLRFSYNGGNTTLTFLTAQCEIAKTNAEVISYVQYINGSVNANLPPQFTAELPESTTINENQKLTFTYKASDPNVDTKLIFRLLVSPSGAKIDSATGVFTWTPSYSQAGTYQVVAEVSDGVLKDTSNSATVVVKNVDRAPQFDSSVPDTVEGWEANTTRSLTIKATDPDGEVVQYSFVTPPVIPAGASISQTTGLFTWVISLAYDKKEVPIRFRATAGALNVMKIIRFILHERTDVTEEVGIPKEYSLKQNYPNPFNPTTKIKYSIPEESKVVLSVFNILGQKVTQLVNEVQPAGYYSVDFDASKLTSGIYLYKIEAKNYNYVRKMILIK
jgi:hypothetical protein